jgi:anti-anti-sigma regulatory factor
MPTTPALRAARRGDRRGFHGAALVDDRDQFASVAIDFLAAGLDAGERALYGGSGCVDDLVADLAPLGDVDDLVRRGALMVDPAASYELGEPGQQLAVYRDASERAVADGFQGLRVAVDVTELVVDEDDRSAFAEYEHLVDRAIGRGMPMRAMCGYRRPALPPGYARLIGALHQPSNLGEPQFHLCGCGEGLAVQGEIDIAQWDTWAEALDLVLPLHHGDELDIDVAELEFIDHRGLMMLDHRASRSGVRVRLSHPGHGLQRLASIVDLAAVEVRSR